MLSTRGSILAFDSLNTRRREQAVSGAESYNSSRSSARKSVVLVAAAPEAGKPVAGPRWVRNGPEAKVASVRSVLVGGHRRSGRPMGGLSSGKYRDSARFRHSILLAAGPRNQTTFDSPARPGRGVCVCAICSSRPPPRRAEGCGPDRHAARRRGSCRLRAAAAHLLDQLAQHFGRLVADERVIERRLEPLDLPPVERGEVRMQGRPPGQG